LRYVGRERNLKLNKASQEIKNWERERAKGGEKKKKMGPLSPSGDQRN